jgi:hypothetical protein
MKYIVEVFSNFREIHVVEAENEEIAKKIAVDSDYNMSKWLGQQIAAVYPHSQDHVQRFQNEDEYFWDGVKGVDSEGYLTYQKFGGEFIRSSTGEKII